MQDLMCIHHGQKVYFCIEEVGESVFEGPMGFWNDIQEYNKKKRKDIECGELVIQY